MAVTTLNEHLARQILERMHLREVAVSPHYQGLSADLRQLGTTMLHDPEHERAYTERRNRELCAAYGFESDGQPRKPFAFAGGIAIIPVSGMLINRYQYSWGFVTGYNAIRSQMNAALADDDVKGILFDLNSNGGEVAGCFELCDDIFAARGKKPMLGVVDSACYSACYAIASAVGKIVASPSGGAGSIGVVAMHVSFEKALKDFGLEVTFIFAGDHKVDGNPYENLSADVKKDIQANVDKSYVKFCQQVARNRNMAVGKVEDTEARCYRADAAVDAGLIDAVAPPIQAMQAFFDELTGSKTKAGVNKMATNATTPAATEAAAGTVDTQKIEQDARTAERARMKGITSSEHATGREALADHLAHNTDMTVEAATAVLAAAPKTAAPAAPAAAGAGKDRFRSAMDKEGGAGVEANDGAGAEGGEGGEQSAAHRIAQNFGSASGRKIKFN